MPKLSYQLCIKYIPSCDRHNEISYLHQAHHLHINQQMVPRPQNPSERRSSQRIFMHAAAEIRCSGSMRKYVAVVRDISEDGLFLYTDCKPVLGTKLRIKLSSSSGEPTTIIYCEGAVVRVEQGRVGANGVAVLLSNKLAPISVPRPDTMKLAAYRV